jgi:hypothetical protein
MRPKLRKANPNRLTVKQHVFPKRSIARFASGDDRVAVRFRDSGAERRFLPRDPLFCVHRGWDDGTERGFVKRIEDEFQKLAEEILAGRLALDQSQHLTITRFCLLWRSRFELKRDPQEDVQFRGIVPQKTSLTQAQQENLEGNGYIYALGNSMPGRHIAGILLRKEQLALTRTEVANTEWAVVTSTSVEFIVPDTFGDLGAVPLSPKFCLTANDIGGLLPQDVCIDINQKAIEQSAQYYFARDFSKTGI